MQGGTAATERSLTGRLDGSVLIFAYLLGLVGAVVRVSGKKMKIHGGLARDSSPHSRLLDSWWHRNASGSHVGPTHILDRCRH